MWRQMWSRDASGAILLALLFVILTASQAHAQSGNLRVSDILPSNAKIYDKMRVPRTHNKPAVVQLHVTVSSLDSFDEKSMSYSADIFLAQSWIDHRLRVPQNMTTEYRLLDVNWIEHFWVPDLMFKNAKDANLHTMTVPNHYIWQYRDGTLLYMMKLYLTVSCDMDFAAYPHDTQICKLQMESLSHHANDLLFEWNDETPLIVGENIALPQMKLASTTLGNCTKNYSTGIFTCLEVVFTLTRNLGYHFFHTYIPLYIIVIMSWCSFWADPEAALARVSLGASSLLVSVALLVRCQASAPDVSQITAIDVFATACTLFVFLVLIEYFLVISFLGDTYFKNSNRGSRDLAVKIDVISRVAFPVMFVLFNILYWIVVTIL